MALCILGAFISFNTVFQLVSVFTVTSEGSDSFRWNDNVGGKDRLSKKFLYLNDDVMFGRPVYPDDFATKGGGQKVFLSWPVPNCNDGCPNNWVGDGFCDAACNVTLCDFDGGDCNNSTGKAKTRWWNRNTGGGTSTTSRTDTKARNYCSRSCPDAWIGDKHCDRMCKNIDCGFDAGDCGVEIMFNEMLGYNITNQTHIEIINGTNAVYFNLTQLVGEATITDGSHDNAVLVRTATISQKNKIMTLTFHHNIPYQSVSISISYETGSGDTKKTFTKDFNITLSTIVNTTEKPLSTLTPLTNQTTTTKTATSTQTNSNSTTKTVKTSREHTASDFETSSSTETTPNPTETVKSISVENVNDKQDWIPKNNNNNNNENENNNDNNENHNTDAKDNQASPLNIKEEHSTKGNSNPASEQLDDDLVSGGSTQDQSMDREDSITDLENALNKPEGSSVAEIFNSLGEDVKLFTNNNDERSNIVASNDFNDDNNNNNDQLNNADLIDILEDKIFDNQDEKKQQQEISGTGRQLLNIQVEEEEEEVVLNSIAASSAAAEDPDDLLVMKFIERKSEEEKKLENHYIAKQRELMLSKSNEDPEMLAFERYMQNRELEKILKEEGEVFPWEETEDIKQEKPAAQSRKLMDMFGDSLKYVNRLYTVEFGPSPRKVPAHMPHMIDKDLMEEIQTKWPVQWESTSSHSLRNPRDMQYAFSYFYYMIHKKVPFDFDKLWHSEIDINGDGWLNENELRSFAVNVYGTPVRATAFKEFKSNLYKACHSLRQQEQLANGEITNIVELDNRTLEISGVELEECHITNEVVRASNKTFEDARVSYSKRNFYQTTIEGTDEVAFLMVDDNYTVTQSRLDGVRQRRHKFICLNDNINHDKPTAPLAIKVVHDFYESLFPRPSSFELPASTTNHFQYIGDIVSIKAEDNQRNHTTILLLSGLIVFVLFLIWKQQKSKQLSRQNKKYYIV
ncbi:putative glycophosphotransferase [Heterostelium album PN500]|uniref:Putative glycophosphotransferase n=1 Tax=Heterostelium pallidum (strain ATCC 26659 / Pp 5 / PN500) TaxID=670386 RepID=D3B058_HETP5|nr:putative glycophosphotransferase [Heterostelium album PN500]EFA84682.1 putative glycophosphotransferase [Heterostelium album PN500]|eukprot:XP_020436795.1 putative glycophosphotransferase [Heterostelium album PN500]